MPRRPKPPNPFRWFESSPEVIRYVVMVMLCVRYPLSLRNVEDLLHERGIDICHETVRLTGHGYKVWADIFGLKGGTRSGVRSNTAASGRRTNKNVFGRSERNKVCWHLAMKVSVVLGTSASVTGPPVSIP